MAWLLIGGATIGAVAYISTKIDELFNVMTDPIYNYAMKSNKDKQQRDIENIRQVQIERTKKMHQSHDEIRNRYGLKKPNIIKLVNNTTNNCDIIYVNHYNASNGNEAITWAKKVLNLNYFEFGLFNKLNTKKVVMDTFSNNELIKKEFDEYFIVLHMNDKFIVLDKDDPHINEIKTKDKFNL